MMITDKGSELIDKFLTVIPKKIQERKFGWDIFKGFSTNCKKFISSLDEDNYPEVDIFRPVKMPPSPTPSTDYVHEHH